MAVLELVRQCRWEELGDVRVRQVSDVVVLGNDILVPIRLFGSTLDCAMHLEDDGSVLKGEAFILTRIRDDALRSIGPYMAEMPNIFVFFLCDIGDDFQWF